MSLTGGHLDALLAAGASAEQIVALVKADMAEREARAARQIPWQQLRQMAFERDGEVCGYCGCAEGPFEVDHKIPRSKGGENILENVIVACAPCNRAKKDRDEAEWSELHARRVKDRERKRRQRDRSRGHCDMSHQGADKGSLEVSPPAPPLPKPSKIAPLSPPKSGKPELPDWMPVEEWAAFKEMRRKMRGIPFTETAERMVMAKLEKLRGEGHDPAKLLSKAVERGHRTVFEDESTRAKSARTAKPMTRDEMTNAIRFHRDRGDEDRARQIENELRGPPPQIASVIRGASSALKVGGGHG